VTDVERRYRVARMHDEESVKELVARTLVTHHVYSETTTLFVAITSPGSISVSPPLHTMYRSPSRRSSDDGCSGWCAMKNDDGATSVRWCG
jgi:hypothetical protein